MEIVDISHNDDLVVVAQKCNLNFKRLVSLTRQLIKKQSMIDDDIYLQQLEDMLSLALQMETTTTLADFFVEDGCTVTSCNAMRWGNMVSIRFSYRLNSALTVPSNGDITDVTLGTLKSGWRPFDMTNVILDQTRILIGDVDVSGVVKARSANSRGSSYTIDANAVLYASMTLMLGMQ